MINKKIILVVSEIILIIIVLSAGQVISHRTTNFERDCKVSYDVNASCPCVQTKYQSIPRQQNPLENLNYSNFNLPNN